MALALSVFRNESDNSWLSTIFKNPGENSDPATFLKNKWPGSILKRSYYSPDIYFFYHRGQSVW
jgi:hypothetical protein